MDLEGRTVSLPTKVFQDVKRLKPLLNENCWQIVGLLSKQAMYPAEIAKKLNLHEQKVYYYIKQLKNAGLIEVVKTEELHGALAKYYAANFKSLALVPSLDNLKSNKEFSFSARSKGLSPELEEFLAPFIGQGKFNAKIVLGSPDPHGQFKARARDNHLAVELAAFFGSLCSQLDFPLIYLDTMIASLKEENSNLILVGGPITNRLTQEVNDLLPIKFVPFGGHFKVKSEASGQEYTDDAIGVIQKIPHPNFKNKFILLVAGNRNAGTKAAITALAKHVHDIIKPNLFNKSFQAKVVEGADLDGDGQIDEVEIKE